MFQRLLEWGKCSSGFLHHCIVYALKGLQVNSNGLQTIFLIQALIRKKNAVSMINVVLPQQSLWQLAAEYLLEQDLKLEQVSGLLEWGKHSSRFLHRVCLEGKDNKNIQIEIWHAHQIWPRHNQVQSYFGIILNGLEHIHESSLEEKC